MIIAQYLAAQNDTKAPSGRGFASLDLDLTGCPVRYRPLWFHLRGLSETASGYGARLTSTREVYFQGYWRRIYVICYSNSGCPWIYVKGKKHMFLSYTLEEVQP